MMTKLSVTPSRLPPPPDAATLQALRELRDALRARVDAERSLRDAMGETTITARTSALQRAKHRVERARADLDSMLLDD